MKKIFVLILQKISILSAVSCRLTKITHKSTQPIHPKHLIYEKLWFEDKLNKDDVVLDLGSSSDQTTLKVAEKVKKVVGIEIRNDLLTISKLTLQEKKLKNVKFIQGDLGKPLPFKNNSFTKVICSDVLEHINRREKALKEVKRVLKKNGMLLLVTDNPDTSWKRLQRSVGLNSYADREHTYEYPKSEISSLLKKNGFEIVDQETVMYDTPWVGFIDLVGGFSLSLYKILKDYRKSLDRKYPQETTGFRTVAIKK